MEYKVLYTVAHLLATSKTQYAMQTYYIFCTMQIFYALCDAYFYANVYFFAYILIDLDTVIFLYS